MERVTGVEPAYSAWKADVLPLNYTRERPDRSGAGRSPSRPFGDHEGAGTYAISLAKQAWQKPSVRLM
jgi:hypothetical protein